MAVGVGSSVTVTPPSQTWGGLKGKIANAVGFGGDTKVLGLAGEGVNNATRYLNTRLWSWLLVSEDLTLVADQADYSLSSNFNVPRNSELLDSSSKPKSRIVWQDPKTFGNEWVDRSVSGDPRAYTIFNIHDTGKVSLNVPPSAAYVAKYPTLRLHYYKRLQAYTSDAEAMKIPAEVELFLEMYAKWEISAIIRPQLTGVYERMWRSYETALLRAESHKQVKDFS